MDWGTCIACYNVFVPDEQRTNQQHLLHFLYYTHQQEKELFRSVGKECEAFHKCSEYCSHSKQEIKIVYEGKVILHRDSAVLLVYVLQLRLKSNVNGDPRDSSFRNLD